MGLYIVICCWMFFLALLGYDKEIIAEKSLNVQKWKLSFNSLYMLLGWGTLTFLWFLTAFRSVNMGNDTGNYVKEFLAVVRGGVNQSSYMEIGYQILNVLVGKISKDPHVFLIIYSSILYIGTAIYIRKYSKNFLISVCLFFCLCFSDYMNILRQDMAMLIALYVYQMLKQNKKISAAILIFLAATFHATAIILFALFLKDFFSEKKIVLVLALIVALLSVTGQINELLRAVSGRYINYFNEERGYLGEGNLAVTWECIQSLAWYLLISAECRGNDRADRLVKANFGVLLFFNTFGYVINIFTRAGKYFSMVAITELPDVVYKKKIKNGPFYLLIFCGVMIAYFLVARYFRPEWNHMYPYEFWR